MSAGRQSLIQSVPTALDEDIVRALAWCRLGSSAGYGYPEDGGFHRAKALGLLAQDSVWRATPQGEGVLIALGLLDPTWKPQRVYVSVLWGQEERAHSVPQFIRAWPEGLEDAWGEAFEAEVKAAQDEWCEWPGESGERWMFWTTVEEIARSETTS